MPDRPLFLERASFRRRRMGDAARVLPILALLMTLVPVWLVPERVSFAGGAILLFWLWAMLIGAIWALHRALRHADAATLRASNAISGTGPDDHAV